MAAEHSIWRNGLEPAWRIVGPCLQALEDMGRRAWPETSVWEYDPAGCGSGSLAAGGLRRDGGPHRWSGASSGPGDLPPPSDDVGQERQGALKMDPPFPPKEFPEALVSG